MPCFHPTAAWKSTSKNPDTGKIPLVFSKPRHRLSYSPRIFLPCGGCIGCRIVNARTAGLRCVHESIFHESSSFITLTYRPEDLPRYGVLVPSHFQDFMKSLRHRLDVPVKAFYCGEYGEKKGRPHFHAIIFGYGFPDKYFFKNSKSGHPLFRSSLLEKCWKFGHSSVGDMTYQSAAYIGAYTTKVSKGEKASKDYLIADPFTGEIPQEIQEYDVLNEHDEVLGRACRKVDMLKPPEYGRYPRGEGLGAKWIERYAEETLRDGYLIHDSKRFPIPRYYKKFLEENFKSKYDDMVSRNKARAQEKKREHTDDATYSAFLARKEMYALSRFNQTKRSYEDDS